MLKLFSALTVALIFTAIAGGGEQPRLPTVGLTKYADYRMFLLEAGWEPVPDADSNTPFPEAWCAQSVCGAE